METDEALRAQLFEIIDNQLRDNDPPETKETVDRLLRDGYDAFLIRQMIAQCILVEVYDVINAGVPYNNERYVKHLQALPNEPFD